jgi:hypothetical protein
MLRSILQVKRRNEAGQALPLFGLMVMVLLGFTAMSVDVGRYVWARTSMQAGVDAAAVAAAQDMPSQTAAEATAAQYWLDNSGFIQAQGENIQFAVSYPPGNKRIRVSSEAEIPTWFAKFFGVDHWTVSAEGDAEAQVLDIAVVFDISGSMCFDSFGTVENSTSYLMSPGRNTPAGGYARPVLASAINSTQTSITLNDAGIFNSTSASTNRSNFGTTWNSTLRYWQNPPTGDPSGGNDPDDDPTTANLRRGVIQIDNELMRITNISGNTLTVIRGFRNEQTNGNTSAASHSSGAEVWANRTGYSSTGDYCQLASRFTPTTAVNGPAQPFDGAIDAAKYFTTLFDAGYDKIGAARYSTNSALSSNLTSSFSTVRDSFDAILFPSGSTNIAGGLAGGRHVLDGTGKRANAVRVLVLLTDGIANTVCGTNDTYSTTDYNALPCSDTNSASTSISESHAYSEAIRATNADIIIFTIGLGNDVNASFLEQVADGGVAGVGPCQEDLEDCRYYFAPTTAQLDEAFEAIAEQTHIALVR